MAGQLHRRYHLLKLLGRGGMGVVYGAWDRLGGREVALKRLLLDDDVEGDESSTVSFQRPSGGAVVPVHGLERTSSLVPLATDALRDAATGATQDTRSLVHETTASSALELTGRLRLAESAMPIGGTDEDGQASTGPIPVPEGASSGAPAVDGDNDSKIKTRESFGKRAQMTGEFRTLATLHHPNVVSVLDYGFDEQRRPYYAMELLDAHRTILVAGRGRSLEDRCQLLSQVLQALMYLHRHGVIHRDLKPGNILCIDALVKITDFGIAFTGDRQYRMAGTVQYMAPELFQGAPPSTASDLYALGVIAHELLTGDFPWDLSNMTAFLAGVMGPGGIDSLPDRARAFLDLPHTPGGARVSSSAPARLEPRTADQLPALSRLPAPLADLVLRLLARDPAERPARAEDVLSALDRALDGRLQIESDATRESFLQSAPLIGRQEELSRMTTLLDAAMHGHGEMLLVGGESGIGKSRLMEELRVQAMVRGAMVLRGQALPSASAPFEVFIDVLRELSAYIELDERDASVLTSLVHDLPMILERVIPDPPELDSFGSERRLRSTMESILLRADDPIVILLEDLHWVDPSSLALLRRLSERLADRAVLVIGSYRDDEKPDLPRDLPNAQVLTLTRLPVACTEALCAAMLGTQLQNSALAAHIHRETEGNALFVVEAVRALAEEAGSLGAAGAVGVAGSAGGAERSTEILREVSATWVPETWAGNIRNILKRRLTRVPAWAEPTLYLLAVAGREVDLKLLREIEANPVEWLEACGSAAVLSFNEGRWRFAHDKLREVLLQQLRLDERQALHLQVAIAIERTAPASRSVSAALAYHYAEANLPERAAHFAAVAGEQALAAGAWAEAIRLLTDALAQQGRAPDAYPVGGMATIHVMCMTATAFAALRQYSDSIQMVESTLVMMGRPLPDSGGQLGVTLLAAVASEARRRIWSVPPGTRRYPYSDEHQREFLRLWLSCGEIMFMSGDSGRALLGSLWALDAAEQLGDVAAQATYNGLIAFLLDMLHMQPLARGYRQRAEHSLARIDDPAAALRGARLRGLAHMSRGEYALAVRTHIECLTLAEQAGDENSWLMSSQIMASLHVVWAAHSRAEEVLVSLLTAADQKGVLHFVRSARLTQAALWLRRGQLASAQAALHGVRGADVADPMLDLQRRSLLARLSQGQGDVAGAYDIVVEAARKHASLSNPAPALLEARYALADICLRLHEQGHAQARARGLAVCRETTKVLLSHARQAAFWRPRALLCEGRLLWLRGTTRDVQRAEVRFRQALQESERMAMPYDEGLAHMYLGLLGAFGGGPPRGPIAEASLREGDMRWPAARLHLRQAQVRLAECEAVQEQAQVSEVLRLLAADRTSR